MRKLLILILATLSVAACKFDGPKTVVIDGQYINTDAKFALLMSKGITDTIFLEEDGTFMKSITVAEPSYFTIRAARVSNLFFVKPGDNVTLTIDIANPTESPTFSGDNKESNGVIFKVNDAIRGFTSDFATLYLMDREDFDAKLDSVRIKTATIIEDSEIKDEQFAALEKARIHYRLKTLAYDYPEYNARLSRQDFTFDPDNYAFMNDIDFNNIKHFAIGEYTALVYKHLQKLYWAELAKDEHKSKSEFERNLMFFEMIDSAIVNQTIRDYYKYNSTSEQVKWASLEVAKNLAEHFIANAKTKVYSDIVEKALAKRMLLAPGQAAPSFTLTGIDGKEYSLEDFKGQLVYIDFWATWCGPCLREIPSLTTLKEAYKNKPIAIIAISLDDDKDAWVKMVTERPLKGIQLHADKAWASDVAQQYQVIGIPTFVLIDGEGKIIEHPATRPSNPEITLILDKHLKLL